MALMGTCHNLAMGVIIIATIDKLTLFKYIPLQHTFIITVLCVLWKGRGKKILPLHGIICKFRDTPIIFFITYPSPHGSVKYAYCYITLRHLSNSIGKFNLALSVLIQLYLYTLYRCVDCTNVLGIIFINYSQSILRSTYNSVTPTK